MEITITGRGFNLDESLKEYIHRRLDKVERLYSRIYKCEVVLAEEKLRKITEVILHLKKNRVIAKETSSDWYASIDVAADSVKKQLRRLNGRVASKRRRTVFGRLMSPVSRFRRSKRELFPEVTGGDIIKTDSFSDKPMLPEEAKLELELMQKDFIMFKNADTGEANVLYRRGDGNYGVIEPDF